MNPEITLDTGGGIAIVDMGQEFFFNGKKCKVIKIDFASFQYKYINQVDPIPGKHIMTYDFYAAELGRKILRHL